MTDETETTETTTAAPDTVEPFAHVGADGDAAILATTNTVAQELNTSYWTLIQFVRAHPEVNDLPFVSEEEDAPHGDFTEELSEKCAYIGILTDLADKLNAVMQVLPSTRAKRARNRAEARAKIEEIHQRLQNDLLTIGEELGISVSISAPEEWKAEAKDA